MRALTIILTGILLLAAVVLLLVRRSRELAVDRAQYALTGSVGETLDRPAEVNQQRLSIVSAPASAEPAKEDDQATGSCIVRLDVPTSVPLDVSLWTYDVPLDDYVRTQRSEILPESIEWHEWKFDPHATEQKVPVSRAADRAIFEVELTNLPLARPLWLLVFSSEWPAGSTIAFAPVVVPIPPLEDASKPAVVCARVEALGGLEVHVEPRRTAGAQPVEEDPVYPRQIRDSKGEKGETRRGHAWIAPLVAGPHDVEVLVASDESLHRRVFHGIVRDARLTDVGTWEFDPEEAGFEIQAVTDEGEPILGSFTLTGPGWAETTIGNGMASRVSLRGDWSHVDACSFHPGASASFEDAHVTIPSSRTALTTIVVPRRSVRHVDFVAVAVLADGTRDRFPAIAFERTPGAKWQPIWLGENGSRNRSDTVEPGARELVAWISRRGVSYVGPFLVGPDADAEGAVPIELAFVETRTRVRGTVHSTCEGLEARADYKIRLRIHGATAPAEYPAAEPDNFSARSPFDLSGLPPDIDFELVLTLGNKELAALPFRVERDQTLDLGVIEIDVCP